MDTRIRDYGPLDEQPVVELALRAWAPVFSSLEHALGCKILVGLHGEWRQCQEKAVRDTLADDATWVWVAEAARGVVALVAAKLHPERHIGEIWMLAISAWHCGHASRLEQRAVDGDSRPCGSQAPPFDQARR
jgi:hypothetical protein